MDQDRDLMSRRGLEDFFEYAVHCLSSLSSSLQLLGRRQEGRDPLQKVPGHRLKEATFEV